MSSYVKVFGSIRFAYLEDKENFIKTEKKFDVLYEKGNDVMIRAYDIKIEDYIEENLRKIKCSYDFDCVGDKGEQWILSKNMDEEYGKYIDGITVFSKKDSVGILRDARNKVYGTIINYPL